MAVEPTDTSDAIFQEFPGGPFWTPFLRSSPPFALLSNSVYEGSRVHPTRRVALSNGVSPYTGWETIMPPGQSRAIL